MKKSGKAGGIGQYVLGRTIGEGTFGKVKLGTHILTGETVAVKILERVRVKETADVERVAREIHILKRVQHPHIISLFEIIETPDHLYIIMEYCNGGELFDHIVECTRVPEPEACRFFQQILSGVEQVHRINVVHRDLKPENLLLNKDKDIKIVDFGLSNIYKDGQLLKTACGSPCYASPEMIAGHWYEPSRCDVWSCGVILFALVCGYLPFEDGNTAALYRKILHADYRTPRFISESVTELIGRMLTTDPEKRITIAEIREHPWYQQVPDIARSCFSENVKEKEIDQEVVDKLVGHGFELNFVVESVRNNKHNNATTSYHLLLEKKRHGQPLESADAIDLISSCEDDSTDTEKASENGNAEKPQVVDSASSPNGRLMKRSRRKKNLKNGDGNSAGDKDANAGKDGDDGAAGAQKGRGRGNRRGRGGRKGGYPNGNGQVEV